MNNPQDARAWAVEHFGLVCASCGYHGYRPSEFEVDHIKPLFEANGDLSYWAPENLQLLCGRQCHPVKTKSDMERFRKLKPKS